MFLYIFLYFIFSSIFSFADAKNSLYSNSSENDVDLRVEDLLLQPVSEDKGAQSPCTGYMDTSLYPYVVVILYKSAGRFVGMGAIIDKRTVLTSTIVVENAMDYPPKLLIMAGRRTTYWGPGAQVTPAHEIYHVETGLALVSVKRDFIFTKNIKPIKIATTPTSSVKENFGEAFAVYGVKRTGWDSPGDLIPKANTYVMTIETNPTAQADCLNTYKDQDFSYDSMMCTFANGSWTWGCIGSPAISMFKGGELQLVGIVFKTTLTDKESYHFHVYVAPYEQWIKAHSLISYSK